MNLLMLAILGIVEAIVWLWRMRTAAIGSASRVESSLSTLATCITRVAFVVLGASAVMAREPWWLVMLAYAIPATLANAMMPHGGGRVGVKAHSSKR